MTSESITHTATAPWMEWDLNPAADTALGLSLTRRVSVLVRYVSSQLGLDSIKRCLRRTRLTDIAIPTEKTK